MIKSVIYLANCVGLALALSCQAHLLTTPPQADKIPPIVPYNGMSPVSFCELPSIKNQLVYVRGNYSGIDEYWSFGPDRRRKDDAACLSTVWVELTLPAQLPAAIQAKLDQAHRMYASYYLVIDAVGTFEDDQTSGYGHLGHNKAQFVVQQLVEVKLVAVRGRRIVSVE